MNKDLRDLLRAWLDDSIDESRMSFLLERLQSDNTFRDESVAEIVLLGQIKATQSAPLDWSAISARISTTRPAPPSRRRRRPSTARRAPQRNLVLQP